MAEYLASKAQRNDERVALARQTEAERLDTHTSLPGRIVSFDPSTQRATVKVLHKAVISGKEVEYPDLLEVPVVQPKGGGGFGVTFPIKEGDGVELRFMSRSMEAFYEEGEAAPAAQARAHSLSDAIAIPGMDPKAGAYSDYDAENVQIRGPGGALTMAPDGKIAIEGGGEELVTILHDLLDLLSGETTTVGFGSSAGVHPLTHQSGFAALKGRLAALKLK